MKLKLTHSFDEPNNLPALKRIELSFSIISSQIPDELRGQLGRNLLEITDKEITFYVQSTTEPADFETLPPSELDLNYKLPDLTRFFLQNHLQHLKQILDDHDYGIIKKLLNSPVLKFKITPNTANKTASIEFYDTEKNNWEDAIQHFTLEEWSFRIFSSGMDITRRKFINNGVFTESKFAFYDPSQLRQTPSTVPTQSEFFKPQKNYGSIETSNTHPAEEVEKICCCLII